MSPVTFKLAYPFPCMFDVKGGRRWHKEYLLGRRHAAIRKVEKHETEIAYRIHEPDPEIGDFDILLFEGRLLWPVDLTGTSWGRVPNETTAEDCLIELETYFWETLGLLPESMRNHNRGRQKLRFFDDIPIRSVKVSREAEWYARAQKAISENLLLVGDNAFAVGGQPIYAKEYPIKSRYETHRIVIANAGQDRQVNLASNDLRRSAGCFLDTWTQERMRKGEFLLADRWLEAADDLLARLDAPRIEAVRAPEEAFSAETIQLDAVFRHVWNFVRGIPAAGWVHYLEEAQAKAYRPIARRIAVTAKREENDETSAERCERLAEFAAWLKSENRPTRLRPFFADTQAEIEAVLSSPSFRNLKPATAILTSEEEDSLSKLIG